MRQTALDLAGVSAPDPPSPPLPTERKQTLIHLMAEAIVAVHRAPEEAQNVEHRLEL